MCSVFTMQEKESNMSRWGEREEDGAQERGVRIP